MTVTEIIKQGPMTLSEVKSELEKIQKRDGELTFRGNKTLEYCQSVGPLSQKKAKDLQKAIEALDVARLKEIHIAKLIDILPTSTEEVKLVLQSFTLTLKDEAAKKIAEIIKAA